MMRQILVILIIIMIPFTNVYAAQDDLDTESLTDVEKTIRDAKVNVSYEDIVKQLMSGNVKGALKSVADSLSNQLFSTVVANQAILKQLIAIAVIASIFKSLSDSFFQGSTGQTAFFVTYIIFIGLMTKSFFFMEQETSDLINTMIDYMKGMISAYSLAVVSTSGITTSTAIYELYLALIYAISLLITNVLMPMIKILFVVKIVNHLTEEEHFSRLCETLESLGALSLKMFLSIVLGVQMIQAMILPAIDSLKNTAIQKGASFLPGIGGGVNSVFTTILGSAVVIKNSIGAAGIIILVIIVIPPLVQIAILVLSYMAAGIVMQPISDDRIGGAIDGIINTGKLMLRCIVTIAALFILSIAIIAFSTNANYYAG